MTRLARVVWNEGMHLAQHHFQTQSRYFEESIRFTLDQLFFEPTGLAGIGFDQEALLNGVVSLTHARGIMPDGTPFQIPETDAPPPPLDVRPIFQPTETSQKVFLALPPFRPGAANCSSDRGTAYRYTPETRNLRDETTGTDERPVTVGKKNFALVLESESDAGALSLPVARVKRDGSGEFVYDRAFVPRCIQIGSSERLMEILGELIELLERKAANLSQERNMSAESLAQYGGQELAGFWLSHAIHSGIVPLRYHFENRRSHPEALYLELARISGALCTFSLRSDPGDVPAYDHHRLEDCFSELDRHIRAHLEVTLPTSCEKVALQRRSMRQILTGQVREEMCSDKTQWIFGVRSEGKRSSVVSSVLGKVKIAEQKTLTVIFKASGMPGLDLEHLSRPPRELAPRVGWEYFLVRKTGSLWREVRDSLNVGVWVPEEIVDADFELAIILPAGG